MARPTKPPWAPNLTPAFPVSVAEATALEAAEIRSEADLETELAPLSAEDLADAPTDEAEAAAEERVADAALAPLLISTDSLSAEERLTYEATAEVPEAIAEEASETAPETSSEAEATAPDKPSETEEAADLGSAFRTILSGGELTRRRRWRRKQRTRRKKWLLQRRRRRTKGHRPRR